MRAWQSGPLKYWLTLNDSGVWGEDPLGEGDVPVIRSTDINLDGSWDLTDVALRQLPVSDTKAKRLRPGDLVVVKSSGSAEHLGKTALVDEVTASLNPCFANFVQRLRPSPNADPRYIWYLLNSHRASAEMEVLGNTTTGLRNLNGNIIGSVTFPGPKLDDQRAIAHYLDSETARIDALIEKKRRLVEVLRERRGSLITGAITRGLQSQVALRDTAVSWLGEVPAHWQVLPLKRVGRATIGLTYAPEDVVGEPDQGTLVLRAGNIQDGEIVLDDNVYVSTPIPPSLRLIESDILICSRNGSARLVGKSALIPAELAGQTWGAFMTVLRSPNSEYLRWILSSSIFNQQLGLFATSTINQLTSGMLHEMQVPFPPLAEQRQIIEYLGSETARIDGLIRQLATSIGLAVEHRQALISAAVTGDLQIPGIAA